jgi:hypothetical protein
MSKPARPLSTALRVLSGTLWDRIMIKAPPPLFTFWNSGSLNWLSVACLKSAVRHGHKVHLYSYGDIPNVPCGVTHKDARKVVHEKEIFTYDGIRQRKQIGSIAPFCDAFRYRGLSKSLGVWMDSDVYILRPMDLSPPTILAWESGKSVTNFEWAPPSFIGNAFMRLPASSKVIKDLVKLTSPPYEMPPWISDPMQQEVLAKLNGKPFFPGAVTYAAFGPHALTYYAQLHRILEDVRPNTAFYPVLYTDVRRFGEQDGAFRKSLPAQCEAIHIWNGAFSTHFANGLPKGSFAECLQEESLNA